jgi:shikimate dehydrogenase
MQNSTLYKMGVNYVYLPFEVEPNQLDDLFTAVRVLDIRGLNVTIPFKQLVVPRLDVLSDEARACGAVNVIKNEGGRLTGYNTDGKGFMASLNEQGINVKGRAVFIGAGGAARSVAYALAAGGISHIDFMDINRERAAEMAQWLSDMGYSSTGYNMDNTSFAELSKDADFIINASPIGMYPKVESCPVEDLSQVQKSCVICDLIYNPHPTRFLLMGQKLGLRIVSGLSMFIHQGALTLEIWTGLRPPLEYMKEVSLNALKGEGLHST